MITLRLVPAPDQQYGKWGFIDFEVDTFDEVMECLGIAWDKTTKKTVEMDPDFSEMHIQIVYQVEREQKVVEIGTYRSLRNYELDIHIEAYEQDTSPDEPEAVQYRAAGLAMNFDYEGEDALRHVLGPVLKS
jgi:hypothetical protein